MYTALGPGIATCYGLDGPGESDPGGCEIFSAPVHTDPEVHPASYKMGTKSLSQG